MEIKYYRNRQDNHCFLLLLLLGVYHNTLFFNGWEGLLLRKDMVINNTSDTIYESVFHVEPGRRNQKRSKKSREE
jgi:hypothetical protein